MVHTHLGCFVGGLLALLALQKVQDDDTKKHIDLATKLVQGCLWTYHPCLVFDECTKADLTSTAKGMLPVGCDAMQIPTQQDLDLGVKFNNGTPSSEFQLRPELVESLFLLFRATLDDRWRRSGWFIYKAMTIHCFVKDAGAFSSLGAASEITGEMPSFFLAETLKYLWLLFEDPNRFSLQDFVFTTEAHPLSTKRMCQPSCDDELLFLWWWDSTHTFLLALVTIATCLFLFFTNCRRLDQMLYEPIDRKTRGKII
jgi:mannosyl-oligosaccharide alpha-1,2-mannosidase